MSMRRQQGPELPFSFEAGPPSSAGEHGAPLSRTATATTTSRQPTDSHSLLFRRCMNCFAGTMIDLNAWYSHLDDNALARLKIRCKPLDLATTSTQYLRPIPLQTMTAWIQEKKPWFDVADLGLAPNDMCIDAWTEAKSLGKGLRSFAIMSEDEYHHRGMTLEHYGLISKTQWTFSLIDTDICGRHESGWFDVTWTFDPLDDIPHISAFLAIRTKLNDDSLHAIEACCILQLTSFRLQEISSEGHIIPIVLISASDYSCRVIVAHLDVKTGILHVKKSPLLHFDYTGYRMSDDFVRIMCWMLADPIGDTKFVN